MVDVRSLTATFKLDTGKTSVALSKMNKRMDKTEKNLKKIRKGAKKTEPAIKGLGTALSALKGPLAALGVAGLGTVAISFLGRMGAKALDVAGDYEQTTVSFETMLGSAEKANVLLADLDKFSLSTPFEPEEVVNASKKLLGFGVSADKQIETMKKIGDVASGLGIPLGDLAQIFGKTFVKGKVQAEELNQMSERGIPILAELAETMGVSKDQIFELASKGQIGFDKINAAFDKMTKKGGKFNDMMAKQSKTSKGLISTFEGFKTTIFRELGTIALPVFKELTEIMIDLTKKTLAWLKVDENVKFLKDTFADMGEVLKGIITIVSFLVKQIVAFKQLDRELEKSTFGRILKRAAAGPLGGISFGDIFKKAAEANRMIEGKAGGGPVSANRPVMVGERGPELFIPKVSGDIAPNGTMPGKRISIGNLIGNATFIVNGSQQTGQKVKQAVRQALNELSVEMSSEMGI